MPEPKQYSEQEHLAILSDRVSQETATLKAENDQLKSEKTDLQSKLDVAESAKLAAEQARETAVQELTTFKTEVEGRETAQKREQARVTEIKAKLPHLGDDWFAAEGRLERIVAKSDEEFAGYLTDLMASVPAGGEGASREVPRESAMQGAQLGGDGKSKPSAARGFLMRDYEVPAEPAGQGV